MSYRPDPMPPRNQFERPEQPDQPGQPGPSGQQQQPIPPHLVPQHPTPPPPYHQSVSAMPRPSRPPSRGSPDRFEVVAPSGLMVGAADHPVAAAAAAAALVAEAARPLQPHHVRALTPPGRHRGQGMAQAPGSALGQAERRQHPMLQSPHALPGQVMNGNGGGGYYVPPQPQPPQPQQPPLNHATYTETHRMSTALFDGVYVTIILWTLT